MALKLLRRPIGTAVIGILALVITMTGARADAIDGEWCREGRNFVIDGPNIVTYGGTRMTGDYDRHGFRYTVPASEPEAGIEIVMALQSETTLTLYRRPKAAPATPAPQGEVWNRCRVTS